MKYTPILSAFFLALLFTTLFSSPLMAQEITGKRTITVMGEGETNVAPDVAVVRFGVVTRHKNPEEARRLNAEAASEAMNAVRALGIEERNIQLETLRLQPVREYNQEAKRYEEVGFEAIRQVKVDVEDLEKLPALVATVVQKGANRLVGIAYDLKAKDASRNEALREAAAKAREKAQLLASALGATLGQVLTIHEQNFYYAPPQPYMRTEAMAMKADAAPEPDAYASGEIEVRASVQVVFEIE